MARSQSQHPRIQKRSIGKRLLFSCVSALLVLALLEGLCTAVWVITDVVDRTTNAPVVTELKEDSHCRYDEELGWVNRPSTQIVDFYGAGLNITINTEGVRSIDPNESLDGAPERYRVVCLGDSFTLGYGVDDRETFPFQLQREAPEIQVVNMGQGGYSIGQSLLWL